MAAVAVKKMAAAVYVGNVVIVVSVGVTFGGSGGGINATKVVNVRTVAVVTSVDGG